MTAVVVVVGVGGVGVKDTTAVARWAVPLASAPSRSDQLARVCGGHCGHGEYWFLCPDVPPFNITLHERGLTVTKTIGALNQSA
jgi:hypothetical protein